MGVKLVIPHLQPPMDKNCHRKIEFEYIIYEADNLITSRVHLTNAFSIMIQLRCKLYFALIQIFRKWLL